MIFSELVRSRGNGVSVSNLMFIGFLTTLACSNNSFFAGCNEILEHLSYPSESKGLNSASGMVPRWRYPIEVNKDSIQCTQWSCIVCILPFEFVEGRTLAIYLSSRNNHVPNVIVFPSMSSNSSLHSARSENGRWTSAWWYRWVLRRPLHAQCKPVVCQSHSLKTGRERHNSNNTRTQPASHEQSNPNEGIGQNFLVRSLPLF